MGILNTFGLRISAPVPELVLCRELVESTGARGDWDTMEALLDYVNAARTQALIRAQELPPVAVQVYEVNRYLSQVNNGGHGQYERNSRRIFDTALPAVEQGLAAMGAEPFLTIFREFRAVIDDPENRHALSTADRGRDLLGPLDARFFEADRQTPLIARAAQLVKASAQRLVPAAELPAVYDTFTRANPFHQSRAEAADVAALGHWFCNTQMVAAGMLLGTSEAPDMLVRFLPGQVVDYDGRNAPALRLGTATGTETHMVMMDDLFTLHAPATAQDRAEEQQRRIEARPATDRHHHAFVAQGIGRCLAALRPGTVDAMCNLANQRHVPLAVHDLLRHAGLSAPDQVGWLGQPDRMIRGEVSWVLRIRGAFYTLVMSDRGFALYARGDDRPLARIDVARLEKRQIDLLD